MNNARGVQPVAVASARSFGDFVIAHSVINRLEDGARSSTRLISCSHVKDLNAILPKRVQVTLLDSGAGSVPALFDIRKRGALAAIQSAASLRREFCKVGRQGDETLVFSSVGVRERFIAGAWPVVSPRVRGGNVYETYIEFFAGRGCQVTPAAPQDYTAATRCIGIFPESRLLRKTLRAPTLAAITECVAAAGLDARIFILGEQSQYGGLPGVVCIPRSFQSLAQAIGSVDAIVTADSLPAHLAEYFSRPVFVASSEPNEYWLPHGCFIAHHWGLFDQPEFAASLRRFLAPLSI